MPIRTRILLVVVSLIAVALTILDVVSFVVVRRSLVSRTDAQLQAAAQQVEHPLYDQVQSNGPAGPVQSDQCYGLPIGSFGAVYRTSGGAAVAWDHCQSSSTIPHLSASVASSVSPGTVFYTSVGPYRLQAQLTTVQVFGGGQATGIFVVGTPLAPVESTLGKLVLFELIVSLSVLVAAGAAALFLVQVGLRPLERMADTADEIAAGDLSRRVEEPTERTEVGRLGRSLNVMLARIEAAFQAKEASESRLRRFVADASHELRTPLTSIRGYSELFRTGAAARPDDVATALRRIESESARMSVLVEDLLLLARLDQGRPLSQARVDLFPLVCDAAADARVTSPDREISVVRAEPEGEMTGPADLVVLGDGVRLAQVVVNLLSNAVSHTPDGSPIELVLTPMASAVRLEMIDHGPGIPAAEREKVFDRFWRADGSRQRSKGGTGLGLSIVQAVVSAHGGTVGLTETSGGGATFTVEIPRVAPAPSPSGSAPGTPMAQPDQPPPTPTWAAPTPPWAETAEEVDGARSIARVPSSPRQE